MLGIMTILLSKQEISISIACPVAANSNPTKFSVAVGSEVKAEQLTSSVNSIKISSDDCKIPSDGLGVPSSAGGSRSNLPIMTSEIPGGKLP